MGRVYFKIDNYFKIVAAHPKEKSFVNFFRKKNGPPKKEAKLKEKM